MSLDEAKTTELEKKYQKILDEHEEGDWEGLAPRLISIADQNYKVNECLTYASEILYEFDEYEGNQLNLSY